MKTHLGGYLLVSELEYKRLKAALEATNLYRVETLYWPPGSHGAIEGATQEIYIEELTGEKRKYALGGRNARKVYDDALALAKLIKQSPQAFI